jgi:hypothetical protein
MSSRYDIFGDWNGDDADPRRANAAADLLFLFRLQFHEINQSEKCITAII